MPIKPDFNKKSRHKAASAAAAKPASQQSRATIPTLPVVTAEGTQPVSHEFSAAPKKKPLAAETESTKAVNASVRINFCAEALKEIASALKQSKSEVSARLISVKNVRSGAEIQAEISKRAAEAAQTGPPIWTPFGTVDLPFIKTGGPGAPRYDPTAAVAMCMGAENEMAKELAKFNQLIQQTEVAIADLQR